MDTIVSQGIDLMLYGMSTVFMFLTVLVFLTTLMSKAVQRWLPEPEDQTKASPQNISPRTLTLLQLAIDRHRNHK